MAIYNPARIAQSYTAGLESGERRKIRGLDQERIKKEEAAKAKTAAQTARIEGLSSQLYQGDEGARGDLMAEGSKGFAAVKDYEEYQLGQTTAKRETAQFDREAADRELTQSMPRALTITDPSEWDQYEAWARPRSLAAGTSEEMYDQIANMPMAEAQDFLRKQMGGKKQSAFSEQVAALEETGIPYEIAVGIKAGRFATTRDPMTGVAQVIDKSTGEIIFDGSQSTTLPGQETPAPPQEAVVPIAESLGAGAVAKTVVNKIADLFGGDLPFDKTSKGTSQLKNLNNETIQLLRSGLGGRLNVQLQERIEDILVKPNKIFGGEAEAKNSFRAILDTINSETLRLQDQVSRGGLRPVTLDEANTKISEMRTLAAKYESLLGSLEPKDKGDIMRFFK